MEFDQVSVENPMPLPRLELCHFEGHPPKKMRQAARKAVASLMSLSLSTC
jgi:hypothetical protein